MPSPHPVLNESDPAILAVVRHGSQQRGNAAENRRNLKDKARLLRDFEHFRRLCLSDLRQAYGEDRLYKTRNLKNRRLTWLALYRCHAAQTGQTRQLKIVALDRQGNYLCQLIDPEPDDGWDKLVGQAQAFGLTEQDLMALIDAKRKRAA